MSQAEIKDFEYACHSHEEALGSKVFWIIAIVIILSSVGNFYIFSNYKKLVATSIHDQIFLNFIFFAGSLSNGAFRIIWGFTLRHVGFHMVYFTAIAMNTVVFTLLPYFITHKSQQGYFIFFTLSCIVQGGHMIIFSNVCTLVFRSYIG